MAILRGMREPSSDRRWRACHAGAEGELGCSHMVEVTNDSDEALLRSGWRHDGSHWFCPDHVALIRQLHASLFDAATQWRTHKEKVTA